MNTRPGPWEWASLLTLTALWGSAFLLTKLAVTGLHPDLVVAGRLLVACLLLVPLALIRYLRAHRREGRRRPWGSRLWVFLALIAIVGNALPFSLITWGIRSIDSGLAGILMAVMPLATLTLAHYLVPGETMTRYRAAGFLLGFCGVLVLMGPAAWPGLAAPAASHGRLLPMLAVLAGAICYACSAILARLRPPSEALPSAAVTIALAAALMLPFVLSPTVIAGVHPPGWVPLAAVLALGVFSTAMAAVVYLDLVKRAGPAFVSQLNYFIPVWALVMGMVFLGEQPQTRQLAALVLILGGVLLTQLERPRVGAAHPRVSAAGARSGGTASVEQVPKRLGE